MLNACEIFLRGNHSPGRGRLITLEGVCLKRLDLPGLPPGQERGFGDLDWLANMTGQRTSLYHALRRPTQLWAGESPT
jgi:hypothetical protein